MNPYRECDQGDQEEDELWLRLDQALESALTDPPWAWGVAWSVARDGIRFPDLHRAASEVMAVLYPLPDLDRFEDG